MYEFNDPFPYAYVLIPVLPPILILKYLFYNGYLFKVKKLFGEKLNWQAWKYIMLPHLVLLLNIAQRCQTYSKISLFFIFFHCKYMQKLNLKLQKIWRDNWASKLKSRLNSCYQVQGLTTFGHRWYKCFWPPPTPPHLTHTHTHTHIHTLKSVVFVFNKVHFIIDRDLSKQFYFR